MNIPTTSTGNTDGIPPYKLTVYYKLRGIFPSIDPAYIKDLVINPINAGLTETDNIDSLTSNLTDYLLINGHNYEDINYDHSLTAKHLEFDLSSNSEVKYKSLTEIFSDADPDYLKEIANKYNNQPEMFKTFIEDNLNEKRYPTYKDYVERKKLEEKFSKNFTKFKIKNFFEKYPEPIEYFDNKQRNCEYDENVYQLLVYRYQDHQQPDTIKEMYTSFKYNPSCTALYFDSMLEDKNSPRDFSKEHIKQLKNHFAEFSFICHRKVIEEHMKKLKSDTVIQCACCYNDFITAKCSSCDDGHIFCNDCIRLGTEYSIANAIYFIQCFENCKFHFNEKTLKKVLSAELYNILLKNQQESSLIAAGIENLEICPFCNFKSEVKKSDDKIFSCSYDDCKKQSCRKCKKNNHLPYECKDVLEPNNARLYLERKMTEALVRNCYNCKQEFVKESGCNRMSCSCGSVMCYICDEPVSKDDYKHFNGQGASNHHLCPLYSDDDRQEAESVITVAKTTVKEILKKCPDFDSSIVDALLPVLPAKAAGPHEDIPNSYELPEHALKVARAIPP